MSARYCIIGAGPCGLTAARHFLGRGIPFDCFEAESRVGGNWYLEGTRSSVYSSTHLISSKRMTEFPDFPMPDHYPAYPHHRQALDYLEAYARHFDVLDRVQTGRRVDTITPDTRKPETGGWQVKLAGESSPRAYRGVVLATGHHWDPLRPELPGEDRFAGTVIHSQQYKHPQQLTGRKVLVVGAGNSGCDIAVEAAENAEAAYLSMRRGYHFVPKFLFGKPADQAGEVLDRLRLPMGVRRGIVRGLLRIAVGPLDRYGLPRPDHRLFETHPIVNSQLLYFLGHGRLVAKGAIDRLEPEGVRFQDGSFAAVDLIVLATGYRLSFPMIDVQWLNARDGRPQLFLHAYHPIRDDLFVIGMIQPNGALWPLAHDQAKLAAAFLVAASHERPEADWFRRRKKGRWPAVHAGIRYLHTPRHFLEVEYFAYRRAMRRLLARFRSIQHLSYRAEMRREALSATSAAGR